MNAALALPGPPPFPTSGAPVAGCAVYAPGPGVCACLAVYEKRLRVTRELPKCAAPTAGFVSLVDLVGSYSPGPALRCPETPSYPPAGGPCILSSPSVVSSYPYDWSVAGIDGACACFATTVRLGFPVFAFAVGSM